jgi:hypothetical protein
MLAARLNSGMTDLNNLAGPDFFTAAAAPTGGL